MKEFNHTASLGAAPVSPSASLLVDALLAVAAEQAFVDPSRQDCPQLHLLRPSRHAQLLQLLSPTPVRQQRLVVREPPHDGLAFLPPQTWNLVEKVAPKLVSGGLLFVAADFLSALVVEGDVLLETAVDESCCQFAEVHEGLLLALRVFPLVIEVKCRV